jgi:hypothetical protein
MDSEKIGMPKSISIVSQCCSAPSKATFGFQSHWMTSFEKSVPAYWTCQKCGNRCENKLIYNYEEDLKGRLNENTGL